MSFLTRDYLRTDIRQPPKLYSGLDAWLFALVNWVNQGPGPVGEYLALSRLVDSRAAVWKDLGEKTLRSRLLEFRLAFRRRQDDQELLLDALAAIREAAFRHLGLRPFPVQLAGALALHHGCLAEMATGEGKTLAAAMTAILQGWTGLPCHIITVNDYLAGRDARWMEPLYRCCWVSVGSVTAEMGPAERREGHRREVTYTTNKEIVADFLRDRLWLGGLQNAGRRQIACLLGRKEQIEEGMVTRGIHAAIVDEADSILIDEAVTPLIISRSQPDALFSEACLLAHELARGLERGRDYSVDEKRQEIRLLPGLEGRLQEQVRASSARYRGLSGYLELVHQALSAREFFQRDKQYVLHEGKVVIVDEFTGRQMPQRTWRAGLHQFIEAREGLELTPPTETLARLSFQRFYRFFRRLSGMTGTAREALQEFWDIYRLPTVKIPENRPCRRQVLPVRAFPTAEAKWRALAEEIQRVHSEGRPVLVGTRNVRASENLSSRLERLRLEHRVLNAVRHQEEALIVAGAGQRGAVTIATNMAGRGTDIRLGQGVEELGGLHVIASEGHESQRIDRQLFGRSARQGDPGSARLFVSLEDEIPVRYLPEALRRMIRLELERRFPAAELQAAAAVRLAQHSAQQQAYRRRRAVLQMDNWLEDSLSFGQREIN